MWLASCSFWRALPYTIPFLLKTPLWSERVISLKRQGRVGMVINMAGEVGRSSWQNY